jgi:hypothetical protein
MSDEFETVHLLCEILKFWGIEQSSTDSVHGHFYSHNMASDLSKSIDAIANFVHLIGISLDNSETAALYVGLAEDELKAIRLYLAPSKLIPFVINTEVSRSSKDPVQKASDRKV